MLLSQYEQAILSAILSHPDPIRLLAPELSADKFGYGVGGAESSGHRVIYQAALACRARGIPPDIISVEHELGANLDTVGGTAYLRELANILPLLGIQVATEQSLRAWATIVDNMGRIRQLSHVLSGYSQILEDKERALRELKDVDIFIAELISDLWEAQGVLHSDYKHISIGTGTFRRRLEHELHGKSIQIPEIGWPSFRSHALPYLGGMTVIAGLPGAGKTQLALQIMLGQLIQLKARGEKGCAAVNSYEMTAWRIVSRLVCCLAKIDSILLRTGKIGEGTEEARRLFEWSEFLEELPIYIDDSNLTTSPTINWQASALHTVNGPLVNLIVDYAEQVPMSEMEERHSRERQVSSVYQNAVNCAKATGCAAHVLSQFTRQVQFSKYKIAGPGGLRYGGAGWQLSDCVIEVWNPISLKAAQISFSIPDSMNDKQVFVIIEKYRDGPVGAIFPLNWDASFTRFSDPFLSGFGADLYENLGQLDF